MHQTQSYSSQQPNTFQPSSTFRQMPLALGNLGQSVSHSRSTTSLESGHEKWLNTASNALSGVLNTMKTWVGSQAAPGSQAGRKQGLSLQNAAIEFTAKSNSMELDIETPKQKGGRRSLDVDLNVQDVGTNDFAKLTGVFEGTNNLVSGILGQTNPSSKPNQLSSQSALRQMAQGINHRLNGATIEFDAKPNSVHLDLETPKSQGGQRSLDVDVDLRGVGTRDLSRLPGAINGINNLVSGLLQQTSQNSLKVDLDVSMNQSSSPRPQRYSASRISAFPKHSSSQFINPAGKPSRPRASRAWGQHGRGQSQVSRAGGRQ